MKTKTIRDKILIAGFILVVSLPTLDTLFKIDHAPVTIEKRKMASLPNLSSWEIKPFFSGITDYFSDHFGYRKRLVRLHNKWKRRYLGVPSSDDVVFGKDDWLFFGATEEIESARRSRIFLEDEKTSFHQLYTKRIKWLENRGIDYILVIAPNKSTLYSEKLPDWMAPNTKNPSIVDQMKVVLEKAGVSYYDTRSTLDDAKRSQLVYSRSDTHWNDFGAYLVMNELVSRFLNRPEWQKSWSDSNFQFNRETVPGGDLALLLGLPDRYEEVLPVVSRKGGWRYQQSDFKDYAPSIPMDELKNSEGKGTAVVITDSFGNALKPYLGEIFKRVIFITNQKLNADLIEAIRPDIVINILVERGFITLQPETIRMDENL